MVIKYHGFRKENLRAANEEMKIQKKGPDSLRPVVNNEF